MSYEHTRALVEPNPNLRDRSHSAGALRLALPGLATRGRAPRKIL